MAKSKYLERESLILSAAESLIIRFGYDKTTVQEIAQAAGISKGAIYLHFHSKEALFIQLLISRIQDYAERWLSLIDADPQGATFTGLYRNSLIALQESTFLSAIFRQDRRILGVMIKNEQFLSLKNKGLVNREFIQAMQESGAIRNDLSAEVIAHIMSMLSYGLIAMDDVIDADMIPPIGDTIEAIGMILDHGIRIEGHAHQDTSKKLVQQLTGQIREQLLSQKDE
ncbi:hypothetical protein MASR2M15_00060 [Anaerolineales bacterium]